MKPLQNTVEEAARHRKKSQTASKSKSNKKADHKHQYKKIIIQGIFGFGWGKCCSICGRIVPGQWMSEDFIKPEFKNRHFIGSKSFLTIPEIREKFPGIDIFGTLDYGQYEFYDPTDGDEK